MRNHLTGTYTDLYQLTMAQVYFQKGRAEERAIFDYFFRKTPFDSGYVCFAGLETALDALENLSFSEEEIRYLQEHNFDPAFLEYLRGFRFRGNVWSSREGDVVFPTRPVLSVEANIIEAQIAETLLLNLLNYQSLVATKAARMRKSAGSKKLIDFGMRRAQGLGAYHASRAAVVGGFDSTSNVRAAMDFDIPVSGTMAHSFIQSDERELDAFRDYAHSHPENCILLVDTYNTLKSGVPNALQVAREMREAGYQLKGIRLDSGDLAYFSRKSRQMLDEAGFPEVAIAASNQLDENVIRSLEEQNAPIDVYGVGTQLVTGGSDSALDGVYKLAFAGNKPRIKVSENKEKTTLPGFKQVYRIYHNNHEIAGADVVALRDESQPGTMHHPFEPDKSMEIKNGKLEPLLHAVMENGKRLQSPQSLVDIRSYSNSRLEELPVEYKRFENPHVYKVGLSPDLKQLRDQLIQKHKS